MNKSDKKAAFMKAPAVVVLASGVWPIRSVKAGWSADQRTSRIAALAEYIESHWLLATERAARSGQILFTTDLVSLRDVVVAGRRLYLRTGSTSYKDYVGTNKKISDLRESFDERDWLSGLANPLALCVCVQSVDGFLLIARRSMRTFDHPGFFHVPGGHIEVGRHVVGARAEPYLALRDELEEEFGITEEQLSRVMCTGVIADAESLKPELLLTARVKLRHHELRRPLNEEHGSIHWLRESPTALRRFLLQHNRMLVPAGKACLLFYGRWRYGSSWYQQLARTLRMTAMLTQQ